MDIKFKTIVASIAFTLAGVFAAQAMAQSKQTLANAGELAHGFAQKKQEKLRVALWGDEFYNDEPSMKADDIKQTITSMNRHGIDFTLFAGDTKHGHTPCTDAAIGRDVVDVFNKLDAPTLYSLGDNEWTDCHRKNAGGYDPVERLAYIRKVYFSKNTSQGKHPIKVNRQGKSGQAYSENSRFVRANVEFVALHIPGSNNNFVATAEQCHKKSNRTQADCDAATAEYTGRNKKNIEWLKGSFDEARSNKYAGIAIVIQADIFRPFALGGGGYKKNFLPSLNEKSGFTDFFNTLIRETHNYDGQVLLVNGDSHYFKVDKPMFDKNGQLTKNFTRVEVFGNKDNSWIEMTVDAESKNVFSFNPVILK